MLYSIKFTFKNRLPIKRGIPFFLKTYFLDLPLSKLNLGFIVGKLYWKQWLLTFVLKEETYLEKIRISAMTSKFCFEIRQLFGKDLDMWPFISDYSSLISREALNNTLKRVIY